MRLKRLLWISDFMLGKDGTPLTGYGNISDVYCQELFKDYNIIALGFGYLRNQHNYLFSLTQTPVHLLGTAIQSINSSYPLDHIIACCDIPLQRQLVKVPRNKVKYSGIFAVEAPPIYPPWAMDLANMDYHFPISEFGKEECERVGLNAQHLVIPVDRNIWKARTKEEQISIKDTLGLKDKVVLFVNAAGNERKNLATVLETVRDLKNHDSDRKYYLFMLANLDTQVSWDLRELVTRFDLNKNVTLFEKGLSQTEVRRLYAASDFFINISKAEGMCFPILEAMSVGVPVIATNATAMKEHLADGRGIAIEPDFKLIDVFGNTDRFYIVSKTLEEILSLHAGNLGQPYLDTIIEKAQKYIDERNSVNSIDMLRKVIENEQA